MKILRTSAVMILVLSIVVSMAIGAAKKSEEKHEAGVNLMTMMEQNPDLSTLVKQLKDTGLATTLEKPGPYTIFAPTNAAFKGIPQSTLSDKTKMKSILKYHIINGKHTVASLRKMKSPSYMKTLEGKNLTITHDTTGVMVNKHKIMKSDMASNGVTHEISAVLMPPGMK